MPLNNVLAISKWLKAYSNGICDRIIERSGSILLDYAVIRPCWLRELAHWAARSAARACATWRDLPQMTAYDLEGAAWRLRVAGDMSQAVHVAHVFFPGEEPDLAEVGRVPRHRLPGLAQQWLAEGVDLVLCQKPFPGLWRGETPIHFAMPSKVEQYLLLDTPLERVVAGRRGRGIRARLNHARDMGLAYRFSQDIADFDRFYRGMYLPFISRRHGQLAVLSTYGALRAHFERGGLLLITRGADDVAGSVCYLEGGVLYAIEEGIIDGDADLLHIGINAFLYWCSYEWAVQHQAHTFSLGGSYATVADGAFDFKAHWGARVKPWRGLADYWEIWAGRLTSTQYERFNALELVAEVDGHFFRVWVTGPGAADPDEFDIVMEEAVLAGLDGVLRLEEGNATACWAGARGAAYSRRRSA